MSDQNIVLKAFEFINIFSPIIPFFFQALKIKETKSSAGFSKKMILLILAANILRIFFWFGEKFHYSLLLQSILMILMQLYLLFVAVKFGNQNDNKNSLDLENMNITNYYSIILFFTINLLVFSYILTFKNIYYVQGLGSFGSLFEAMMAIPQIIEIYNAKSTKNLSFVLVSCWFIGDFMKTYYFYSSNAPLQMFLCGMFQICLNIVILLQIILYRNKAKINVE